MIIWARGRQSDRRKEQGIVKSDRHPVTDGFVGGENG